MKQLFNYTLAFVTEKVHRYVFDHIYFCNADIKKRKLPIKFKLKEKAIIWIYKKLFKACPKFRLILKYESKKYQRYTV